MATLTQVVSPNVIGGTYGSGGMDVDPSLVLKGINKKLNLESVLDDVFEDLGERMVSHGKKVEVPNAVFLKLEAVANGTRTVTVPMLMALTGAPHIGPGTPIGEEKRQNLKFATFNYEEVSYAVTEERFGKLKNEMQVYNVFGEIQPGISLYMKELHGERIREAIIETFDSILTGAASGAVETPHLNKNWFVPNRSTEQQPSYVTKYGQTYTPSTGVYSAGSGDGMVEAVADALELAADTADGINATASLDYFRALDFYAANNLRIDPIMVNGKKTYIVLVPSTQVYLLETPVEGQLGGIFTGMVRATGDEMKYTGVLGRIKSLLLVEDQRYPTLTVTGADGSWIISPAYVKPGNSDSRNKAVHNSTSNKSWDCGALLGKAALVDWVVTPLHFEYENQNYNHDRGTGVFGEEGISCVQYDIETQADGTKENYGSVVLPFATPTI